MEDESAGKTVSKTRSLAEFVQRLRLPYEPFDVQPGLVPQVRMADTFAKLLDPAKVTPEAIKKLLRPLVLGAEEMPDSTNQQDDLLRSATARFVHMVILAHTDGDVAKAEELLDSISIEENRIHDFENSEFTQAVIDELQDLWRSERSAGLRR